MTRREFITLLGVMAKEDSQVELRVLTSHRADRAANGSPRRQWLLLG
jgi:hypothetical protein